MSHRYRLVPAACVLALLPFVAPTAMASDAQTYHNPLAPRVHGDGSVDSCADPTVIRGQRAGDRRWYLYCTTDPLNDQDTNGPGPVTFHPVPTMVSRDLVHWRYAGDALPDPPSWAADGAGLWAPDVVYSAAHDRYYLTFVVTDVDDVVSGQPGCATDSAIGVATSRRPTGPWHVSDSPVVGPRRNGPGCDFFWTYDPDVLGNTVHRRGVLYYGSYYGGIHATRVKLLPHTMKTTGDPTPIAIPNRYEGANVVRHGHWYYLFASATNCCNGPLTGYSVFAGRSRTPWGPFRDREGNSFTASRVGGTPVVSMNGNRWVGTGHNSVFRDLDGQWWTIFHAVDRFDPYFADTADFTRRPALLDPLDWVDGWPQVRAGRGASDRSMPAPAAQPGDHTRYHPISPITEQPGHRIMRLSDEFTGARLGGSWTWVRRPTDGYDVANGRFRFRTQDADLTGPGGSASVLTEPAPDRDYVVEAKVRLGVPVTGCCHNYNQVGLMIYGDDDRFIKLVHVSIWETRQTEFAKEAVLADGAAHYGNTVVGAPAHWTFLRIVRRTVERPDGASRELYTAYTSQDRRAWVRGGTWTHRLGDDARIGLVSMGAEAADDTYPAAFEYVRVSRLTVS